MNRFRTRLEGFSRRGFLGGTGAAVIVGLPMLEGLLSRKAFGRSSANPSGRLVCISSGNGMPMDEFQPNGAGATYTFKTGLGTWGTSTLWESFAPLHSKVSVFTGLEIPEGAHSPGDNGAGLAASFTCARPAPQFANTNQQDYLDPNVPPPRLGVSIDQVMASQLGTNPYLGPKTRIPSLQLALRQGAPLGDGPFGPVYLNCRSWKSATEPLRPIIGPAAAFDGIFGGYDPNTAAAEQARRLRYRTSVLDYVAEEGKSLLPALSPADRQRLDQYFSTVRSVEQKLQQGQLNADACGPPPKPASGLSYPDAFNATADLIALALACNASRVVMLQLSCYRNDDMYAGFMNNPRVNDNHHALSKAFDNITADSGWRVVCRWIMSRVADVMTRLDAVHEPTGTLLDNSVVVYCADEGDGGSDDHFNLPVVVGGSAGGRLPTGRYFKLPKPLYAGTHCAGLYVTLLQALGVKIDTFGEQQVGPLTLPTG